ncbi:MAG: serine protease [Chromatiales bacterium]|nr:serine protease [Chromatiales bacterium]
MAVVKKILSLLVCFAVLTGCQSNPQKWISEGINNGESPYSFLYTPAHHLEELVDAQKLEEAKDVYLSQIDYFLENRDAKAEVIGDFFALFDSNNRPLFSALLDELNGIDLALTDQGSWASYKALFERSTVTAAIAEQYPLYREFSKNLDIHAELKAAEEALRAKCIAAAPEAFAAFDHLGDSAFSSSYPVALDDREPLIVDNHAVLIGMAENYSTEQLEAFNAALSENYSSGSDGIKAFQKDLGNIYFKRILKTDGFTLINYLTAAQMAQSKGFNPSDSVGQKIAVIDGSSQSLLHAGQLEFPVSLETDVLGEVQPVTLQEALDKKNGYRYALVFSVNTARTERRIQNRVPHSSRYVSGERRVPNPAYETARMDVFSAQSELSSTQSQYCSGWGCLAKVVLVSAASSALQEKESIFASTPATITEDVFSDYEYSTSVLTARKAVSANYYLVDLVKQRLFSGTFDISESRDFQMAYNVHKKDKSRASILKEYDEESVVHEFEEQDVPVLLSQIIEQVNAKKGKFKPFKVSYNRMKKTVLADRHEAIKRYKLASDNVLPERDVRMEHVVVVYTPEKSMGTGFYVKPDLVLTNYHVVEGSKYVEIKTHGGEETFGKVVKSDVRLDLALVKVQQRGKPVEFYSGSIPLGSTVEAIGHPKGYEFSITRGVVSAVRKGDSIYGTGGKKVVFVQSDTPINKGNSGGPMFLGDKVVAVNNNKRVGKDVEGLAFSIHYTEVADFLRKDF